MSRKKTEVFCVVEYEEYTGRYYYKSPLYTAEDLQTAKYELKKHRKRFKDHSVGGYCCDEKGFVFPIPELRIVKVTVKDVT